MMPDDGGPPACTLQAVARFERVEQIAEALQAANQPTDTGLRSLVRH